MIEFWWSGIVRTSVSLTLAAVGASLLLRWLRPASPAVHRTVWALVLLQGLAWLQAPIRMPSLTTRRQVEAPTVEAIQESVPMPIFEPRREPVAKWATETPGPPAKLPVVERSTIDWRVLAFGVWWSGVLLLVGFGALQYVLFRRRIRRATPAAPEFAAELLEEAAAVGVSARVELLIDDSLGPLLCRLPSRHAVVVPRRGWQELSETQRRMILRHELAHLARGDLWMGLAARLAAVPQWFNPCAWYAIRRFDQAAEWACDGVAATAADNRPAYASALLALCEKRSSLLPHPSAASVPVSQRIRRLLAASPKGDPLMKRLVVVLPVVTALAAAMFEVKSAEALQAAAQPPKPPANEPGMQQNQEETRPKKSAKTDAKAKANLIRRQFVSIGLRNARRAASEGDALFWALTALEVDTFRDPEDKPRPNEGDWEFVNMMEDLGRRRWVRLKDESTVEMIQRQMQSSGAEKLPLSRSFNWRDHEPLLLRFMSQLLDCATANASRPDKWAAELAADPAHEKLWRRGYQAALRIAAEGTYPQFELFGLGPAPAKDDAEGKRRRVQELATVVRTMLLADAPFRSAPASAGPKAASCDQLFQELLSLLRNARASLLNWTMPILGDLYRDMVGNPQYRTPANSLRDVFLDLAHAYPIEQFFTHGGFGRREVLQMMRDRSQTVDLRDATINDVMRQLSLGGVFSVWIDQEFRDRKVNVVGSGSWQELVHEAVKQAGLSSAELDDGLLWIGPEGPGALRKAKSTLRASSARCSLAGETLRPQLLERTHADFNETTLREVLRFMASYHNIEVFVFVPYADELKVTDRRAPLSFHLWLTLRCSMYGLEWLPVKDALVVAEPARIADIQRRVSETESKLRRLNGRPEGKAIAEKLGRQTAGDFDHVPFADAMGFLSSYHSIPIVVEGDVSSSRVTCEMRTIPFATILDLLCAEAGCDWDVRDGKIVVAKAKK